MILRVKILLVLLLVLPGVAAAQTTSVSGTITDAGGVAWKNGSFTFTFTPSPNNPTANYFQNGVPFNKFTTISGSLDATGSLTSVAVPDSLTIVPSGSTWATQVCPAATATCFKVQLTITGASQSITSAVVPPAVVVTTINPGFYAAYTDGEISGARQGTSYFNLTDSTLHVCNLPVCTWLSIVTPGSTPSFSSVTATAGPNSLSGVTNVQTINGSNFSVKGFGATGNGVTNDFTAIQNTINAVQTNGGGTVYFPCGNYFIGNISTPLQFTGNGSFGYGETWTAENPGCVFIVVGASPTASWVVANSTPVTCIAYLNIIGLHFVANGATIGAIDYNCVDFGKIHQNWFSNFNGVYIKFEPTSQNIIEVSDNRIEANFEANGQGFLVLADWIHSLRNSFGKLLLQSIIVGSGGVGPYKFESGFDHFFHCRNYNIDIQGQVLGYRIHDDSEELDTGNAKTVQFGIRIGTAATNPSQVSIVNWDAQSISGPNASYQVLNNTTASSVLGLVAIAGQNNTPFGLGENGIQTQAPIGTPAYQAGTPGVSSQGIGPYIFNFGNQGTNASFFEGMTDNLFFDGTNWHLPGNGSSNGGWGLLGVNDLIGFYTIPSTGGTDQTITNANLAANNLRAQLTSTGFALKVPLTVQGITGTVTVGSGTMTTNGTAISTLTAQSQPAITITGALATDVATCSLNAAMPATWQTGIVMLPPVVTANTVTIWLSNPTATATITPAATVVRCTVTR